MGGMVYGPAVLQTVRGLSPLAAGYVVGARALFWTAVALLVAGLTGRWPNRLIRLGALSITVGLAACALIFEDGLFSTLFFNKLPTNFLAIAWAAHEASHLGVRPNLNQDVGIRLLTAPEL